jgi:hypothetical protein
MEGAGLVARTGVDPALRVDLLSVVTPESVPRPRCAVARSLSHEMSSGLLPGTCASTLAVTALPSMCSPVRAGVMAADRLAVEQERRDRLAEYPGELAIAARFALINLGALRM